MLEDKKAALITGGAKNIGAFIAKTLAGLGFDLIIHYNNSKKEALKLQKFIKDKYNIEVFILSKNLLKDNSCKELVDFAFEKFPYLNTLINNASIFLPDNLFTSTEEAFMNHCNIHVKVPFFLSREFITKQTIKKIHIINIVDKFIEKSFANKYFSYLLSKKSLHILTKMLEDYIFAHQINAKISAVYPKKIDINRFSVFDDRCDNLPLNELLSEIEVITN